MTPDLSRSYSTSLSVDVKKDKVFISAPRSVYLRIVQMATGYGYFGCLLQSRRATSSL